ncbi:MAG: patatin-like phospholipase family protein [Solirubrobacterales bacterium]
MGKVVDIDRRPRRRGSKRRKRPSKTALVLGGGGLTGGTYEIGALRALDLLAVNAGVNDFDMYVGTSAGSFVGTMLAAGVTPDEMLRVLTDEEGAPIERMTQNTMLRPTFGEYAKRAVSLPAHLAGMARNMIPRAGDISVMDIGWGLAEHLPSGLYSNEGIEGYVREALATQGINDSFDSLQRDLYITATDIDSGERVVLGEPEGSWSGVPISKAVQCSTALPLVYEPVEVNGRVLVDGGIYSTTNVDVAVDRGAQFIVVVNPLVPLVNDREEGIPTPGGREVRRIADMGLPAIANQTFRLLVHQRLKMAVQFWNEKYPGVDILLIEPEMDDELMFGTSIMDYSSRLAVAAHGFESVTARLADNYDEFKQITERHGLEISATRLRKVIRTVKEQEPSEASVWRRIFDQTTGSLLRQTGADRTTG